MLVLIINVRANLRTCRWTHRKSRVPVLPPKPRAVRKRLMDPTRRTALEALEQLRQGLVGAPTHQQVNMIGHAANPIKVSPFPAHDAAHVFKQTLPNDICDQRRALLGAEDDMKPEARVGVRHTGLLVFPAPLQGALGLARRSPGVTLCPSDSAPPPATCRRPSGTLSSLSRICTMQPYPPHPTQNRDHTVDIVRIACSVPISLLALMAASYGGAPLLPLPLLRGDAPAAHTPANSVLLARLRSSNRFMYHAVAPSGTTARAHRLSVSSRASSVFHSRSCHLPASHV